MQFPTAVFARTRCLFFPQLSRYLAILATGSHMRTTERPIQIHQEHGDTIFFWWPDISWNLMNSKSLTCTSLVSQRKPRQAALHQGLAPVPFSPSITSPSCCGYLKHSPALISSSQQVQRLQGLPTILKKKKKISQGIIKAKKNVFNIYDQALVEKYLKEKRIVHLWRFANTLRAINWEALQ